MSKTLVLFDFDGTLTKRDTFNQFIFFAKGFLKGLLGYILFSPYVVLFFLKIMKGFTLKEKMTSYFFRGEKELLLNKLGEEFIQHLYSTGQFKKEIHEKMIQHKKNNDTVCIVSASLDVWVKHFCERNGINYLCTEIQYENGICTGNFKTPNCNNEEKALRIKQSYNLNDYSKIIAYGNSNGDKAMFALSNEIHLIK